MPSRQRYAPGISQYVHGKLTGSPAVVYVFYIQRVEVDIRSAKTVDCKLSGTIQDDCTRDSESIHRPTTYWN